MKNDELNPCKECGNRPSIAPNGKVMCIHWNCDRFEKELTHDGWNKYNSTAVPIKEQDVCPECGGCGYKKHDPSVSDEYVIKCSCTGKAPGDKIREAFEKEDVPIEIGLWMIPEGRTSIQKKQMTQILFEGFKAGYKSQQAEIERLKDKNESMRCCGNCKYELNQESSVMCEYCTRYENNFNEGGNYSDNWHPKENN